MAERLQQAREWFKNKIITLSRRAKILWIVGAVLFVLIISFIILSASKIEYVVFNRGLSPEQSGEISAKMTELGIEHKVEDNASTILVNSDKVDEARMQLALSGFASSQILTYDDIYDKISFTMTAETKNKLFLQAKKGAIANSLMVLEPVEKASVELYVKKSSTFINLTEDVSRASVALSLKRGAKLSNEQVEGIVSFIVDSVEGLAADRVTLIDQNGIKLNKNPEGNPAFDSVSQYELKASIEDRIDKGVTDFLSTVYGSGNVRAKSTVKLNFNSEIIDSEEFKPPVEGAQEGLIRSINELKENVVNKEAQGAVGTDSNTDETPQYPTEDSEGSGYKKTQKIMNYELNNVKKHLEKEKGQITEISVAVFINKKALVDETLSPEDETKLTQLVKASTDDFQKETNIQISAMDFFEEEVIPLTEEKTGFFGVPIWILVVIIVGVIGVIVLALVILKKRKKESEEIIEEIQTEQEELEEIQSDFEDKSSPKYQIEKFIDSRPEIVAQLLRSWMSED